MAKIYVGDVGLELYINMQVDLTTATGSQLTITRPDGTTKTVTPTVYNQIYYLYKVKSGDLTVSGLYKVQPTLTLGDWTGRGDTVTFPVYD